MFIGQIPQVIEMLLKNLAFHSHQPGLCRRQAERVQKWRENNQIPLVVHDLGHQIQVQAVAIATRLQILAGQGQDQGGQYI